LTKGLISPVKQSIAFKVKTDVENHLIFGVRVVGKTTCPPSYLYIYWFILVCWKV